MLVVPFRSFDQAARRKALPPRTASSTVQPLVQSIRPGGVSRLWVSRSRFAVGRFLGCAVFPRRTRRPQLSDLTAPLCEFRSPPEYYPADPSQPAAASQHLSWASAPSRTRGFGGPLAAGLPRPLRSGLRVWPPSRRLTPSEPLPALFRAGGAHGIRPSELSPPARYPGVSTWMHPPTVSPAVASAAEASGRRGRPRFLGFDPCRSPWRPQAGLAPRPLDAPLGFTLLGSTTAALGGISPSLLSRASPTGPKTRQPAPQSFDQPLSHPARSLRQAAAAGGATLLGFSHRLVPKHAGCRRPGYELTSRRVAHYCRPPDALWAAQATLPELLGPA
jgi:hypothetical protein